MARARKLSMLCAETRLFGWRVETGLALAAFSVASMVAAPSSACPMTQDFFTYDDGTNLADIPLANPDGTAYQQGGVSSGATWTSTWDNVGTTPVDAFTIENGKVEIGDTDGVEFRVERGFNLSEVENLGCPPPEEDPTCSASAVHEPGAYYTATELTQVQDNHDPYEFSVEFLDDDGLVMKYGIENDGVDAEISPGIFDHSDYFFAVLGDTKVVSTVVAEPDEQNFVFTALYIDDDPGGLETLKVWINPNFTDMMNGINYDIEITRDLESVPGITGDRSTIGETVAFVAMTDEENMVKTFDDFQIVRDMEMLQSPRMDLGDGDIQANFVEWAVGSTSADYFVTTFNQNVFIPSIPNRTVTMTFEALDELEDITPFDLTLAGTAVGDDLRKDGIAADGGLRLIIDNLFHDGYQIKTFHYQTADNTEVVIYVSEDQGSTYYTLENYIPSSGDNAAEETMIAFHQSDGAGEVWIEFRPTIAGAYVALNGLQFIPEPSTGLLVGLGLLGLWRRRRSGASRIV